MTIDREQSQFLNNDTGTSPAHEAAATRRLSVAKLIVAQVELLQYYGLDSDTVALTVSHMNENLEQLSSDSITAVKEHLTQAARILTEEASAKSNVVVLQEIPHELVEIAPSEPTTQVHSDELYDAEKLRKLPKPIINAFYGILPKQQLAGLFDFDEAQQSQLLELLLDLKRDGNKDRFREKHIERLRQVFDGMSMRAISDTENTNYSSVSETFSKALPRFVADHEEEFLQGFGTITARTYQRAVVMQNSNIPKPAAPKRKRKSPSKIKATSRIEGRSVKCPEGVVREVNYLFVDILDFEQIAVIPNFSTQQKRLLIDLVDGIYEHYATKQTNRQWQMARLEKMLDGMTAAEITAEEGSSPNALYQSFRDSLPKLLFPRKAEIRQVFEEIRTMNDDEHKLPEEVKDIAKNTKIGNESGGAAPDQLSPKEREVMELRMGLHDGKRWTQEEIATELGISRDESLKIWSAATAKLKNS